MVDTQSAETSSVQEQLRVIEELIRRSREGRSLVPLLGAGISVEGGIPSLGELTRYLAKVELYIRERLYRPRAGQLEQSDEMTNPSDYLRDFGWPQPEQLEWDLWQWLQSETHEADRAAETAGDATRRAKEEQLVNAAKRQCVGTERYGGDPRHWMDRLVQDELIKNLERLDYQLAQDLEKLQKGISGLEQMGKQAAVENRAAGSVLWRVAGSSVWKGLCKLWDREPNLECPDFLRGSHWELKGGYWKSLLSHLTRSNPDYVDTLFQQLVQNRQPATPHRYFAFLSRVFRLRVFLTTNFDSLLEDALRIEGFQPAVYEALEGFPLPHPSLVHSDISVIKLHGGAFGLRVGDQLDRPLDAESEQRLADYLPKKPVLLVMGLGGWDLRVLDLVELALEEKDGEVFWLRFEPNTPKLVEERFSSRGAGRSDNNCKRRFWEAQVRDPGAFLKELFVKRTHAHPASRVPYHAYDQRPIPAPSLVDKEEGETAEAALRIFVDRKGEEPHQSGSTRLAHFVADKTETHSPIWIDLESKSTVEDVVVDIMDQLRRYDSSLPEVLTAEGWVPKAPTGGNDTTNGYLVYDKVIHRMFNALLRGRYIVAFDGVGSFGRPPFQHHGVRFESNIPADEIDGEPERGGQFLVELIRAAVGIDIPKDQLAQVAPLGIGSSILALSVDLQRKRSADSGDQGRWEIEARPPFWTFLQRWIATLRKEDLPRWAPIKDVDEPRSGLRVGPTVFEEKSRPIKGPGATETLRDATTVLCAFRRRRSGVALRRILPKYLRSAGDGTASIDHQIDEFIEWCERWKLMVRVEGGYYSMTRRVRDSLYLNAKGRTQSNALRDDCQKGDISCSTGWLPERQETLRKLITLASVHGDIATYYQELYASSREVPALLEHFYHRISSLRYLTKLDAWASVVATEALPTDQQTRLAKLFPAQQEGDDQGAEDIDGVPASELVKNGRLDLGALKKRRRQLARALWGTLWRQRQRLLGEVPGTTLLRWAQDFQSEIRRLCSESALDPNPKGSAFDCDPVGDSDTDLLEQTILEILQDIWDELGQLEADIFENRLDVAEVVRVGCRSLACLLEEQTRGRQHARQGSGVEQPSDDWWRDFESGNWAERLEKARERLEKTGKLPILRMQQALFQVVTVLRKSGYHKSSAALRETMRVVPNPERPWQGGKLVADAEYAHVYSLLHQAEHELAFLGLCPEGQRQRRAPDPWEKRYVDPDTEQSTKLKAQRKRAVRLCAEALERLEWVKEEDRTLRSYLHSLQGRAHYLVSESRNPNHDDFRKAFRQFDFSHAALSDTKGSGVWEARAEGHAITYMRHAEALMLRAKQLLDRPSRKETGQLDPLTERARQRLSSAWDLLGLAEQQLDQGRRNVDWRAWLFQLRAQLQVERLLLEIFEGSDGRKGDGDRERLVGRRWGSKTINERGRLIGELVADLRQGLRAVRQGFDVILPDISGRKGEWTGDVPRLDHFLRLWQELMVLAACRTLQIGTDGNRKLEAKTMWKRWRKLNHLEGLVRLPGQEEDEHRWFHDQFDDFEVFASHDRTAGAGGSAASKSEGDDRDEVRAACARRQEALCLVRQCIHDQREHRKLVLLLEGGLSRLSRRS